MRTRPDVAEHDILVVGAGPAGLSAALWGARYRRRVLLVDKGEPRNRWVENSHGYLGADGIRPSDLLERAAADLARYPDLVVTECEAFGGRTSDQGFELELTNGSVVAGLRLIIATGVRDVFPDVPGFFDHYGVSVFHCPTCDGFEAQDQDIVVFGWSEHVAGFSLGLLDWARSVTVVTDGRSFEGEDAHRDVLARNEIALIEDAAVGFTGGRGDLRAVQLERVGEVPCQLAFFSIAHQPASGLALQFGCETTAEGCVVVDGNCETSVAGIYAAGDLTPGMQLIQVAAAKGAIAGVSAAQSLRGEQGSRRSPTPAPDPEQELAAAGAADDPEETAA